MKVLITLAALLLLSACGGGGAHVRSEVTTVSKGQQLIDLKKAADEGALTPEEYTKEKQRVLNAAN